MIDDGEKGAKAVFVEKFPGKLEEELEIVDIGRSGDRLWRQLKEELGNARKGNLLIVDARY